VAIKRILELENKVLDLKTELQEMQLIVDRLMATQPGARVFAVGDAETVILPSGKRPRRSNAIVLWRGR
jgi:hypothetical protein